MGNAQDFGDLSEGRGNATSTSSPTRAVVVGGYTGSATVDTIDFTQIMSKGDFLSFGELVGSDRTQLGGLSNGHGGL